MDIDVDMLFCLQKKFQMEKRSLKERRKLWREFNEYRSRKNIIGQERAIEWMAEGELKNLFMIMVLPFEEAI